MHSFRYNTVIGQTDGRTDGQTDRNDNNIAFYMHCMLTCDKNTMFKIYNIQGGSEKTGGNFWQHIIQQFGFSIHQSKGRIEYCSQTDIHCNIFYV